MRGREQRREEGKGKGMERGDRGVVRRDGRGAGRGGRDEAGRGDGGAGRGKGGREAVASTSTASA
jgi:hypothetical protein